MENRWDEMNEMIQFYNSLSILTSSKIIFNWEDPVLKQSFNFHQSQKWF